MLCPQVSHASYGILEMKGNKSDTATINPKDLPVPPVWALQNCLKVQLHQLHVITTEVTTPIENKAEHWLV
jgi:hypothetical protein